MSNADLIRELTGKWNAGDVDGVFDLLHRGRRDPHGPALARAGDLPRARGDPRDQRGVGVDCGSTLQIEVGRLEEYGDKMVVIGAWRMRGAASGIDGEMPIFIVFTFRDGRIAVLEWFADRDTAIAAARDA